MKIFNEAKLKKIGNFLKSEKQTISVAESVSSGLLQFAFSTTPDAAHFFQGGITAYNIGQKYKHLSVEPIHASEVNCVSQKVASEMALGASDLYASDWAIGITGYATPVPESENKIFAFFSIVYNGKVKAAGKISLKESEPTDIQLAYVNRVIDKLASMLR